MFLVQRQKLYSFVLCVYILLLWVCVFCACVDLQCVFLFLDVFLTTSDASTKSIPVFHMEGTLLCSGFGRAVIMVIRSTVKAYEENLLL